jgi:transcriptional regulator with XRE-family HTH domain
MSMKESPLRTIRINAGYKQSDFAHLGISQQLVSAIEQGHRPVSERVAMIIGDELKIDPSEVIHGPAPETVDKLKARRTGKRKTQASLTPDELIIVNLFRSLHKRDKKSFVTEVMGKWYKGE